MSHTFLRIWVENILGQRFSSPSVNRTSSRSCSLLATALRSWRTSSFSLLPAQVTPPASNMRAMHWDSTIAQMAQTKADKCVYDHQTKLTHQTFGDLGENIYICSGRLPSRLAFLCQLRAKVTNFKKNLSCFVLPMQSHDSAQGRMNFLSSRFH